MANQKEIRKRIASVQSTQKITRAMKMVAGARLTRAQQRILALRPYAVKTVDMLAEATASERARLEHGGALGDDDHPLLATRKEERISLLVLTSDRGLCGAFNASITRKAHQLWRQGEAEGKAVSLSVIGRKGRDYFRRREAPIRQVFEGVWDSLDYEQARRVGHDLLRPYLAGEVDAIYLVYNEFKSAMTQRVVKEALFPIAAHGDDEQPEDASESERLQASSLQGTQREFIFEPSKAKVLERLVPMYIEISILRALYESMASELGARMTAMDSATKNASEMIDKLTLQYNRARQSAITTELMEIIGGANALQG